MLNTENFEQALYEDGKNAFEKIIAKHGNNLYVIGLYHFGGFDGIEPMFNTLSAHKEVQKGLACTNLTDQSYYIEHTAKWNPSDYPSLEEYSEYFENSTREIQKLAISFEEAINESSEILQQRWQQTLRAMERVLIRLDKEGLFSTHINREKITLAISTYDEGEDEQFDRIKRMNPETVLKTIQKDFEKMIAMRTKWEQEALSEVMLDLQQK